MKNEIARKKEIRMMIKKQIVQELKNVKQDLKDLRRIIQEGTYDPSGKA